MQLRLHHCKTNSHTKYIHTKIVFWSIGKLRTKTIFGLCRSNVRTYCVIKNVEVMLI